MLGLAFMAWLTVVICYGGNWILGQCMIERPIVVGLVAGILMGDISAGCIIGASLEAIFMGAVNIGGAISAEPVTATVLVFYSSPTRCIWYALNSPISTGIGIPASISAAPL